MSESLQKNRLYEYKANSNLVLEAERDKRRRDEGSTEVESLHGKLDGIKMGDRNFHSLLVPEKSMKRAKISSSDKDVDGSAFPKPSSINQVSKDKSDVYRPKTIESRGAYDEILVMITSSLGDQPRDILVGAADEVIAILQSNMKENLKFEECQSILGKLNFDKFSKLVLLSKKISDFSSDTVMEENLSKVDEEIGVAVVFDDDDDKILDDVEEDENINEDRSFSEIFVAQQKHESPQDPTNSFKLNPNDIDAHWLQRQVSKFVDDAHTSVKVTEDILEILSGNDYRIMENSLVLLLQFERFDFMKLLLQNRDVIYFCTKYRQAQSEIERNSIENEMLSDISGNGKNILAVLNERASSSNWTQHRIDEYTSKTRGETSVAITNSDSSREISLNEYDSSFPTSDLAPADVRKITSIDLESLQFPGGGHFMSNDQCEFPSKSWRALKKGYEEVHVPAIRPVIPVDEVLTPISSLPSWCQPAFAGVKHLNRIQSKMLTSTLFGSENILLCAPTGSGKTNVAILCILNQIGKHRNDEGFVDLEKFKIVYIAPMKALVQECVQNFPKNYHRTVCK